MAPNYQPGNISITKPLDVGQYAGASVPKGAEKLAVRSGDLVLQDDPDLLPGAKAALVAAIAHKSLTVADIFNAGRAFERAYAEAGYVLTRVVIPPQKLVNGGAVRLQIVNGFLESTDVSGLPERIREPVRARIAPLLGRAKVSRREIERAILLAGDLAGLSLRSTLAPGSQPGGTRIILDGSQDLVSGGLTVDNRANNRIGPWLFNANAAINSGLGMGEQIYLAWAGAPRDPITERARLRTIAVGAAVPIGVDGLTISPEYTWSQTHPTPEGSTPASTNDYTRVALRASLPLVRGVTMNMTGRTGLERIEQKVTLATPGADKIDRYVVLRTTLEAQETYPSVSLSQALSFSRGLGGRDAGDAAASGIGLSRQNTNPNFSKAGLALQGRVEQGDAALSLTFRSQYSFNEALFGSEQFSLDGADALSGFASGAVVADQGAVLRGELMPATPYFLAAKISASPYAFAAYGVGAIRHATAQEAAYQRVTSFGLGVRSDLGNILPVVSGVSWQVEWAHSIAKPNVQSARADRLTTSLSLRF